MTTKDTEFLRGSVSGEWKKRLEVSAHQFASVGHAILLALATLDDDGRLDADVRTELEALVARSSELSVSQDITQLLAALDMRGSAPRLRPPLCPRYFDPGHTGALERWFPGAVAVFLSANTGADWPYSFLVDWPHLTCEDLRCLRDRHRPGQCRCAVWNGPEQGWSWWLPVSNREAR